MIDAQVDTLLDYILNGHYNGESRLGFYLQYVDDLCGIEGLPREKVAGSLQGLLNTAHCEFVRDRLDMLELGELQQYIRAHGFTIDGTLNQETGQAYIVLAP